MMCESIPLHGIHTRSERVVEKRRGISEGSMHNNDYDEVEFRAMQLAFRLCLLFDHIAARMAYISGLPEANSKSFRGNS